MGQLSDCISRLASCDSLKGEDLIRELLGDDGLNFASNVTRQENHSFGGEESVQFYQSHNLLVEYIQIGSDETTRSDIRTRLRQTKRVKYPLFYIVTKTAEQTGAALERKKPIHHEFDILRVEPLSTNKSANAKYFTFDLTRQEPFYFELLHDLRYGSSDSFDKLEDRIRETFKINRITNQFYEEFSDVLYDELIPSIEFSKDVDWTFGNHARLVVNRLLFLLFIQEKRWLNGNENYIQERYANSISKGDDPYEDFFKPLFFDTLCKSDEDTSTLGRIPYFNSELFQPRKFETDEGTFDETEVVKIDSRFFEVLLSTSEDSPGLFHRYRISIRETNPSEQELVIDPEFVGRVFESFMNDDERSKKGAFYTPKPTTTYMAKNAIKHYLHQHIDNYAGIVDFVRDWNPTRLNDDEKDTARQRLERIRTVDPAIGSGAFAIAMIDELYGLLTGLGADPGFELKKKIVARSIYGVDIDAGGIELCKFRVWLSLIQELDYKAVDLDEIIKNNEDYTLPNMNLKFVVGNSLSGDLNPSAVSEQYLQETLEGGLSDTLNKIKDCRERYYEEHTDVSGMMLEFEQAQAELRERIDVSSMKMTEVIEKAGEEFIWVLEFPEVMFDGGFDVVIGNPPYEGKSKQGYINQMSSIYATKYDFYNGRPRRCDLYQKFIVRGWELVRKGGVQSYITSNTFFTLGSKSQSRNLLQENELHELLNASPDTFDASVHPAIFAFTKTSNTDAKSPVRYIDGRNAGIDNYPELFELDAEQGTPDEGWNVVETIESGRISQKSIGEFDVYQAPVQLFKNSIQQSFFKPTLRNIAIWKSLISEVRELANRWEDEIMDSSKLEDNIVSIRNNYLKHLEAGDVTLVGLLTVGGVGLQTGKNRNFIAYHSDSPEGQKIIERNGDGFKYVDQNEETVGVGKMGRVINDSHIANVDSLTPEERLNGISGTNTDPVWVPITKGKGQPYSSPQNWYINWSESSVRKLKSSSDARWQGDDYFFEEGLFISRGGTGDPTIRHTTNAIIDSSGGIYIPTCEKVSVDFLNGWLNSNPVQELIDVFINGTVNTQVNDIRTVPVIVPSDEQLNEMEHLVKEAKEIQSNSGDVSAVQARINKLVKKMLGLAI